MQPITFFIGYPNSGKTLKTFIFVSLIIIVSFLPSCVKNKTDVQTGQDNIQDTLEISGKTVVFFSITKSEYDSIVTKAGTANEIDETLSDFSHYSGIVIDSLNKTGINSSISTAHFFKIINSDGKYSYFSRSDKEQIVGVIIFDGRKEPQYHFGVATDADYFDMIENYFYKKQVE